MDRLVGLPGGGRPGVSMDLGERASKEGFDFLVMDAAAARAAAQEALATGVATGLDVFVAGEGAEDGWIPSIAPDAEGLRMRLLFDAKRGAPPWVYPLLRIKGTRVRALPAQRPVRLLLAGEAAALVALGHRNGNRESFLWTREPALVASLREFFDVAWATASPVTTPDGVAAPGRP